MCKDIKLNILLFIPFGFVVGGRKGIVFGLILSCCIELTQYVFCLGYCEMDDVLNNTIGASLGVGVRIIFNTIIRYKEHEMNKKRLVANTVENLRNINRRRITKRHNDHRIQMLKHCGIEFKTLTDKQKKEIDLIYKKFGKKYSYTTHQLVYSVTGVFNPYIIPEDFYRVCIDPILCEYDAKYFLSDKNYFNLFMPNVVFPETIIKNIRGSFYDSRFQLISEQDARQIIKQYDSVVVKPSNESGFGRGVELVEFENFESVFDRKRDYIVQKLLKQHPSFSMLNESSVNIVRIVTLFLNDRVRVVTAAMRVGGVGDFTDNVEHQDGTGMIVVGIDNGKLKKWGYHSNGSKVLQTPGGQVFEGFKILNYDKMVQIAINGHERFPQVRFIGWDFTLDSNGNVIAMEYNTKSPGVLYYQYVNGPLFGSSTNELLDYVLKRMNG